ncbi:MAG: hypothetical protein K0U36_05420 [Alphaproteobacteria bacterium]|nr:hypothetical protein [Alphaproteobacteria bacterium]
MQASRSNEEATHQAGAETLERVMPCRYEWIGEGDCHKTHAMPPVADGDRGLRHVPPQDSVPQEGPMDEEERKVTVEQTKQQTVDALQTKGFNIERAPQTQLFVEAIVGSVVESMLAALCKHSAHQAQRDHQRSKESSSVREIPVANLKEPSTLTFAPGSCLTLPPFPSQHSRP